MMRKQNFLNIFLFTLFSLGEIQLLLAQQSSVGLAGFEAAKNFWEVFEQEEIEKIQESNQKARRELNKIQEQEKIVQREYTDAQIKQYRSSLQNLAEITQKDSSDTRRLQALADYALISFQLAKILKSSNAAESNEYLDKSLASCREIEQLPITRQASELKASALYIKAQIFSEKKQKKEQISTLKSIIAINKLSTYAVHALMNMGDEDFNADRFESALAYYRDGLQAVKKKLQESRTQKSVELERLRQNLYYRMAWASYRSADLSESITYAKALLGNLQSLDSRPTSEGWRKDCFELIGNSLFELDEPKRTESLLMDPAFARFAPGVITALMKRQEEAKTYDVLLTLIDFSLKKFPLSAEVPSWIAMGISHSEDDAQSEKKALLREHLARLMVTSSSWRQKNSERYDLLKFVDSEGINAGELGANYFFERGKSTANVADLIRAASLFKLLSELKPASVEAQEWAYKRANSLFYAGQYEDALVQYESLINDQRLAAKLLQEISYQRVLCTERIWRRGLEAAVGSGKDPLKDQKSTAAIVAMKSSVNDYANRFPNEENTSDALLLMASALRDRGDLGEASVFWERVLLNSSQVRHRTLAIRGIVVSLIEGKNPEQVVQQVSRYLSTEDWSKLGAGLRSELLGVLTQSAMEYANFLSKAGKMKEGGGMLVHLASQFEDIPNRQRLMRDGAYMLAIAGEWNDALVTSLDYQRLKLTEFLGDMVYLQARALEFQMRFGESAEIYLAFAMKYPKHNRATTSLLRAYQLAYAESDFVRAGQAAEQLAKRSEDKNLKLRYWHDGYNCFTLGEIPDDAERMARAYVRDARTPIDRLQGQLMIAKAALTSRKFETAMQRLNSLAQNLAREKSKLAAEAYSPIASETHFLLAMQLQAQVDDYNLGERSGDFALNVAQKSRFFSESQRQFGFAISIQNPLWSSRARYELAAASERFAFELASQLKDKKTNTEENLAPYKDQIERLKQLARRQHSENVLARAKDPEKYSDIEYVKLSAMRLNDADLSQKSQAAPTSAFSKSTQVFVPQDTGVEFTSQWSE